jgi:hypothetical protein
VELSRTEKGGKCLDLRLKNGGQRNLFEREFYNLF